MTSPVGAEVKQGKTSPVFYEPLASNKKLVPQPFVPKSYLTRLGSTPPKIGINDISKTDVAVGASIYASPLLSAKKSVSGQPITETSALVTPQHKKLASISAVKINKSGSRKAEGSKANYVPPKERQYVEDITKTWGGKFLKFTRFEKQVALENLYNILDEEQRDQIISIFSDDKNTSFLQEDSDVGIVLHEGASVNDSSILDDSNTMWSVDTSIFKKKSRSDSEGDGDLVGALDGAIAGTKPYRGNGTITNFARNEDLKKMNKLHVIKSANDVTDFNSTASAQEMTSLHLQTTPKRIPSSNIYTTFSVNPVSFLLRSLSKSNQNLPCFAEWDNENAKLDLYLDSVEGTHLMSGQLVSSEKDDFMRFDICLPEYLGGHRICLLDQVHEVPLAQFNVFTEGHYSDTLYQRPFVSAGAGGGVYKAIQNNTFGSDDIRRQLAAVQIKCEENSPRKVLVLLPCRNKTKDEIRSFVLRNQDEDMLSLAAKGTRKDMVYLLSKEPEYDKELSGYVLDLDSRVSLPSSKNVALYRHGKEKTVFSFGKCAANQYALSIASPMSLLHGFSVALASIASSIQVDERHGTNSDYDDSRSYDSENEQLDFMYEDDYYY